MGPQLCPGSLCDSREAQGLERRQGRSKYKGLCTRCHDQRNTAAATAQRSRRLTRKQKLLRTGRPLRAEPTIDAAEFLEPKPRPGVVTLKDKDVAQNSGGAGKNCEDVGNVSGRSSLIAFCVLCSEALVAA